MSESQHEKGNRVSIVTFGDAKKASQKLCVKGNAAVSTEEQSIIAMIDE